jgi:ADP-L-glycero-D-manno-heptose 6-epimerase
MKILVTGHKGFIGSNLMKSLQDLNHTVTGFEWGDNFPGYDFDTVMHLGAISSTNEKNVDKILQQNYEFSVWLVEACNKFGINFQYSSSASVYGLGNDFSEDAQVDPKNPYAWSKYLFERYLKTRSFEITVQGFRYFNVYGNGEQHKTQPSPYEAFSRSPVIKLFTGSENIRRDFVPVSKVINTHIEFLKVPESGVWNIGSGKATSFLEVAQTFNKPIEYIDMPNDLKSAYQYYTCADLTKLKNTINKYSLNIPE